MINTRISIFIIVHFLTWSATTLVAWADDEFRRSVESAIEKRATIKTLPDSRLLGAFSVDWCQAAMTALEADQSFDKDECLVKTTFTPSLHERPSDQEVLSILKNGDFKARIRDATADRRFVGNFDKTYEYLKNNHPAYKNSSRQDVIQYWLDATIQSNQAGMCPLCLCYNFIPFWGCNPPPRDPPEESPTRSGFLPSDRQR